MNIRLLTVLVIAAILFPGPLYSTAPGLSSASGPADPAEGQGFLAFQNSVIELDGRSADGSLPTIEKMGPAGASYGEVITYQIVVHAPDGESIDGTVLITDTLPAGVQFAGSLSATYGTANYANGVVTWSSPAGASGTPPSAVNPSERPVSLRLDAAKSHDTSIETNAPLAPAAAVSLAVDDGSMENSIGLNDATSAFQFIWLNRFTPAAGEYPFNLTQISVLFPSMVDAPLGADIDLVVYTDNDSNPSNGASLLATIPAVVQANDGETWSVYDLSSSPVFIDTAEDVLIGVIPRYIEDGVTPVIYPAALDDGVSAMRSWIGWWNDVPPASPTLPPDSDFNTADWFGFAGNWMLRGEGQTTPLPEVVTITFNVSVTAVGVQTIMNQAVLDYKGDIYDASWSLTTYASLPLAFNKIQPTHAAADQPTSVTLTWGSSGGAVSYEYCIDTTHDTACTPPSTWTSAGGSTSVLVNGLKKGITYSWQVRAVNLAGTKEADNAVWWRFTTQAEKWSAYIPLLLSDWPPIPTAPHLEPINNSIDPTSGYFDVYWSWVNHAEFYILEQDDDPAFASPVSRYEGTSEYMGESNVPSGTWYYRVKACSTYGCSPWSNVQAVTVGTPTAVLNIVNATGGSLCIEVLNTGIGRKCSSAGSFTYGSFPSGTYKYNASASCGTISRTQFYPGGTTTVTFDCTSTTMLESQK